MKVSHLVCLKKMEVFNLKSLHVIVTNLEDTYTTNKYTCQIFCIIKMVEVHSKDVCTIGNKEARNKTHIYLEKDIWKPGEEMDQMTFIKPTYILKKTSGSRERRWTKCRFRDYAFSNLIFTKRKRKHKMKL